MPLKPRPPPGSAVDGMSVLCPDSRCQDPVKQGLQMCSHNMHSDQHRREGAQRREMPGPWWAAAGIPEAEDAKSGDRASAGVGPSTSALTCTYTQKGVWPGPALSPRPTSGPGGPRVSKLLAEIGLFLFPRGPVWTTSLFLSEQLGRAVL